MTRTGTRSARAAKGAAFGVAVLVATATGCGEGDDTGGSDGGGGDVAAAVPEGYAATPEFIAKVVDESTGIPYRCVVETTNPGGSAREVGTCASDGERVESTFDMLSIYEPVFAQSSPTGEVPEELADLDWSLRQVTDATTTYVRAPIFEWFVENLPLSAMPGSAGEIIEAFGGAGQGWGAMDLAAVEEAAPGTSATGAVGGVDASTYFDMLGVSDEVTENGTDDVDGEPVSGLRAVVSLEQMYEAQGVDIDQLAPGTGGILGDVEVPIEVWVDADGRIRRIDLEVDADEMADAIRDAGGSESDAEAAASGANTSSITFSDFGDRSIEVEVPPGDEVVDITDDFVAAIS